VVARAKGGGRRGGVDTGGRGRGGEGEVRKNTREEEVEGGGVSPHVISLGIN